MYIVNGSNYQVNKQVKVRIEELESIIRNKRDWFYILDSTIYKSITITLSISFTWRGFMLNRIIENYSFWEVKL